MAQRFALSVEQTKALMKMQTCREFFAACLHFKFVNEKKRVSYANLARLCGFGSRNYPRELLMGRRQLTPQNAEKMANGLRLTSDWAEYSQVLLRREKDPANKKLCRQRDNLEKRIIRKFYEVEQKEEDVFSTQYTSMVYAALGDENGTPLEKIAAKTKLSHDVIKDVLSKMTKMNLVVQRDEVWIARASHQAFSKLKKSGYFQKLYWDRLQNLGHESKKNFERDDRLFWEMTYSVNADDLPQLTLALKEVLSRFCEDTEKAEGSKIVSLAAGLVPINE